MCSNSHALHAIVTPGLHSISHGYDIIPFVKDEKLKLVKVNSLSKDANDQKIQD